MLMVNAVMVNAVMVSGECAEYYVARGSPAKPMPQAAHSPLRTLNFHLFLNTF
jgi:hypothetical protein